MKLVIVTVMLAASACAGGQAPAPSHPLPEQTPPSAEPTEPIAPPPPPDDAACKAKACTPPEECIRYYGIAGPSVPLYTCGIPCGEQGECPNGLACATIADGPRICR